MIKKTIVALMVLSLVVLASSCGGANAKTGGRFMNWNINSDPKTLDPCLNGANDGGNVISQTFEGLVRERSGVVQPGIAKSWKFSEDGLTLTFELRKSNWSNGKPLTAKDFVYSWKRGMNPATASEYSWI